MGPSTNRNHGPKGIQAPIETRQTTPPRLATFNDLLRLFAISMMAMESMIETVPQTSDSQGENMRNSNQETRR